MDSWLRDIHTFVANGRPARIKKVTHLLLLDVTEARRRFWSSAFKLDKKFQFDHRMRVQDNPQKKENII